MNGNVASTNPKKKTEKDKHQYKKAGGVISG
jgi:hypothetical protein